MNHIEAGRRETRATTANGYLAVLVGGGALALGLLTFVAARGAPLGMLLGLVLFVASVLIFAGLYMQQPNEARILTLFGRYSGTDRAEGLRWANPLVVKRKISLRARNLNAPTLKVNDKRGNPVEISAAVVWRVEDTARAVFEVDDFEAYVRIQAEAAIRHLAVRFAYDEGEDLASDETTLRAGQDEVAAALKAELQARFGDAGVNVLDAKITHLAYAPEIAQVMLRRQQADAIISARKKIVHGAG